MGSPHSSNNLVDQLASCQLISNLTPINDIDKALKSREVVSAARGSLRIGTQIIDTIIGVREDFPHSLPVFFIVPNDILGFIPHVDHDGYVCYADREGVLLKSKRPIWNFREFHSISNRYTSARIKRRKPLGFCERV